MYITAGNVDAIQMLCKTAANMRFYLSLQCFYAYTENACTVDVCELRSLGKKHTHMKSAVMLCQQKSKRTPSQTQFLT